MPEGFEITHQTDYCQVSSWGNMNTFKTEPARQYTVTVVGVSPCSALQLGFCEERFQIPVSGLRCDLFNCRMMYFGVGDAGYSVSYDPIRMKGYGSSKGSIRSTVPVNKGDTLTVTIKDNGIKIMRGQELLACINHQLEKPCPCVSVFGEITVKLHHKKRLKDLVKELLPSKPA
jgi:hypothetical protein